MPTDARITTRYTARVQPEFVEDDFDGQIWQPDVYEDAARVARAFDARGIIDIGCGEGAKLAALNDEFEKIGLDLPRNIATCRERYPAGNWIEHDLMSSAPLPLFGDGMVIICADVIEHVSDPVLLLAKLAKALERGYALFISTPERELTYSGPHNGPSLNPRHVQEWTLREFCSLARRAGLTGSVVLTRAHDATMQLTTILAVYGQDLDKIEDVLIDRPDVPMLSNRLRKRVGARVGRELRRLSRSWGSRMGPRSRGAGTSSCADRSGGTVPRVGSGSRAWSRRSPRWRSRDPRIPADGVRNGRRRRDVRE